MRTMKKIGIGTMAVIGTAAAVSVGAKIADKLRRKCFMDGFHMGEVIGSLTAAESFTKKQTALADKYNKLCEEYATDYQKLMELDSQKNALDEELLSLYEKWEELNS